MTERPMQVRRDDHGSKEWVVCCHQDEPLARVVDEEVGQIEKFIIVTNHPIAGCETFEEDGVGLGPQQLIT